MLVLSFVGPNLRRLTTLGWHTNIQPIAGNIEITGADAHRGRNIGDQFVVIRIVLLKCADYPFTANYVNPLSRRVEKDIVAFACRSKPSG